jgi:rare lipoprotein A
MRSISVLAATAACAFLGACTTTEAKFGANTRASLITDQRAATGAASGSGGAFAGRASFYGHPGRTASGGRFNPHGLTAAHRTLPFGTKLRVSDPKSGRSVVVTVNDRGPFTGGRVLDLSLGAAQVLGMTKRGVMHVRAERM